MKLMSLTRMVAACALSTSVYAQDPVSLRSGRVAGTRQGDVRVFKGIPYAQPPVGALRWRAPQPPSAWDGVRDATKYGSPCPQPRFAGAPFVTEWSEDCLTINVWAPVVQAGARLPVLVSIPGGGFFAGGSNDPIGGQPLAESGVVVVSFNYRLGVFGFFAHPQLARESSHGTSGNYGLMDQVMALQWIRDNIAVFGGDPANVTISGSSAGGSSALYLMVSPLARGLFTKAIAQSAAAVVGPLAHVREARYGFPAQEAVGRELGDDINALRALPAAELLERSATRIDVPFGATGRLFWPAVDGVVLPDEPWRLLASGRFSRVPLLLGTTDSEGAIFVAFGRKLRTADAWSAFLSARHPGAEPEVIRQHGVTNDSAVGAAMVGWVNAWYFHGSTRAVARRVSAAGLPTFLYSFTRVVPGQPTLGGLATGALHSMEMAYLFDAPIPLPRSAEFQQEEDRALARAIKAYWVAFVRTGDPNGDARPHWPRYDRFSDEHLELGSTIRSGTALHRAALDAYDRAFARMAAALRPARGAARDR